MGHGMKPKALPVPDYRGRHNGNLEATTSRLLKGGSWKRQRIVVVIPAAGTMQTQVAFSHWNLMFPPNNGVHRILAQGLEVGDAYSQAIMSILNSTIADWEYVLTIEHDNLPPGTGVLDLVKQMEAHPEFACIGGLYFTKGEGGVAQIWGDPKDPVLNFRPQVPIPGALMECCGTGMGFNLWRLSMFRDLVPKFAGKPLFRTIAGREGLGTQDLSFWTEARKYGYRCAIDCTIPVGHIDETGMIW